MIEHGDHGPCAAEPHSKTSTERDEERMVTTELRAKIRAVPTGGLFFRLLTR